MVTARNMVATQIRVAIPNIQAVQDRRLVRVLGQLLIAVCSCCPLIACGEQVDQQSRVAVLAQSLASPKRAERLAAERELLAQGEKALEQLESLIQERSTGTFHLQQIATLIRHQVAQDALQGTLLTIRSDEASTLSRVTEAIVQQTAFPVQVDPRLRNLPVQLDLQQVLFWKAMDQIGKQADVGWQSRQTGLKFDSQALIKPEATAYSKALRISAVQQQRRQSFRQRSLPGLTRLALRVDVEPLITPYFLTLRERDYILRVTTGEESQTYASFNPVAVREIPLAGLPWFEFTIDFQTNGEIASDQIELLGELDLFCAARTTMLRVPCQQAGREPSKGEGEGKPGQAKDPRLQLISALFNQETATVIADILLPRGIEKFESHRLSLLHKNAWLITHEGEKRPLLEKRILSVDGQRHRVEFKFSMEHTANKASVDSFQLEYGYPDLLTELPVPFQIEGISLSIMTSE